MALPNPRRPKRHPTPLIILFLLTAQLLSTQYLISNFLPSQIISTNDEPLTRVRFVSTTLSNNTLAHLAHIESTVFHNKAVACRSPRGIVVCSSSNVTLVWYNPSNRDRFICDGKILVGPKKSEVAKECSAWKGSLTSHSFGLVPTVENKGLFPGISIKNKQTQAIDDTYSSSLERQTYPLHDGRRNKNIIRNDTQHGLIYKIQFNRDFGLYCDIKCEYVHKQGLTGKQFVHGTDWAFEFGIEGSHYYPQLAVDENAWKKNNYYATTSFKSEIPVPYFTLDKNHWGNTLRTPPVNYTTAIKGASFLARNCGAKNNRNDVVTQLIQHGLRVDSLSTCLNNAKPPPGVDLQNKTAVMEKYLFHLAFENGRVDDYITEKLWATLHSGTLPVVLGPSNIKEHIGSIHGVIYVDDFPSTQDLATYLIQVMNNQSLYESYHEWRKFPYPEEFLKKYNFTWAHDSCRMCRWAFAKKYGLGWDHGRQSIEPVDLVRDVCLEGGGMMKSPVVESWWDGGRRVSFVHSTVQKGEVCPLQNGTIVTSRIGGEQLDRSVWSHDCTTDLYLEGKLTKSLVLKLQLPIIPSSNKVYDSNTVWFQNNQSRISLVFNAEGSDDFDLNSIVMITPSSDTVEVTIRPDHLPLRIRIIVEDQDTFHKGAEEIQTYYGKIMAEDVLMMPELFVMET